MYVRALPLHSDFYTIALDDARLFSFPPHPLQIQPFILKTFSTDFHSKFRFFLLLILTANKITPVVSIAVSNLQLETLTLSFSRLVGLK